MTERKMLMSSRAAPPAFLKTPRNSNLSVKELLLNSPLPSPSLPSILPRHGKKPPPLNTRKIVRLFCWLIVITGLYTLFKHTRKTSRHSQSAIFQHPDGHSYQYVEEFDLPDYPVTLAVTDKDGDSRWTIHIPRKLGFPLESETYKDICAHVPEVSSHVADLRRNAKKMKNLKYYDADTNYIDVAQAQLSDLLPLDPTFQPSGDLPLCKSSLIYVLDSSDAGLGSYLQGLWLAYGLAQHEKRAFFIDDSHFAYGKFSALFSSPPTPKCRPPPTTHRVPCPHLSQHLVVTSTTWQWTFGDSFHKQFSDQQIFEMMRIGYEALFKLLPEDQAYVDARLFQLRKDAGVGGILAGVHIRRGDKHPEEPQYQTGYLPATEYVSAATEMTTGSKKHVIVLASDDLAIYEDPEFEDAAKAQEKLDIASPTTVASNAVGWSHGFFKDAFWSLGLPEDWNLKHLSSPSPNKKTKEETKAANRNYHANPTPEALQLRAKIGRAYLLDLAVLGRTDRIVCTVNSRGCRLLAVMMGWDQVQLGHWKNIDGASGWKGL